MIKNQFYLCVLSWNANIIERTRGEKEWHLVSANMVPLRGVLV